MKITIPGPPYSRARGELPPKEQLRGPCPCCGTQWTTHEHVPPCPPIEPIRAAAREVGYGIGVHGSLKHDFDLIAAPWSDEAVGYANLIAHIMQRLSESLGRKVNMLGHEVKPLGRHACTLQIDGWYKCIDLSIAPRVVTVACEINCDPEKKEG